MVSPSITSVFDALLKSASSKVVERANAIYDEWRTSKKYTIDILEGDSVYDDVNVWLMEQIPNEKLRSLAARTIHSEGQPELIFAYTSGAEIDINIGGHKVGVQALKAGEASNNNDSLIAVSGPRHVGMTIRFQAKSPAGSAAVQTMLKGITEEGRKRQRPPRVRLASSWGGWNSHDMPLRQFENVILKKGQAERIREDLRTFREHEEFYKNRGLPWHRGYLFHGPPGTGKTSVAQALATEFNLDLCYVPLNDMDKDVKLIDCITELKRGSILILEDIDTQAVSQDRSKEAEDNRQVSLGSLLNVLDGPMTPDGLVTIMTSNFADNIDPALKRPGRIDLIEEIGYLDDTQLKGIFANFYGAECRDLPSVINKHISPAQVTEVMKRHMYDPVAGHQALREFIALRMRR